MPTLIGFGAILLWAALALLTSLTTRLPLFEWLALTFGLATLLSLPMLLRRGALASHFFITGMPNSQACSTPARSMAFNMAAAPSLSCMKST